jgi:uncharacterized protein (DUF58 family)
MATLQLQPQRSASVSHPPALDLIVNNSLLRLLWQAYRQRLTPAGQWLILPTFLFGLWGSTSLDHQIHVPCLYALSLWAIAVLCLPFARPRIALTARHVDRIVAGETLIADLEMTSQGNRPQTDLFLLPHHLPAGVESVDPQGVALPTLRPGETVRITLPLYCPRRGIYTLPGYRVCSDFPFGLLVAYRVYGPPRTVLVYPRFSPLDRLWIVPGRRYHPGGVALASNLGESLEFVGSRPFREGDSVRDIDWTASARLDQLIVREYRQEYFHRVAVILDTFVTPGNSGQQEDFERAVSLAASISDYMARQEYLVDLFATGDELYHLTAGRSLAYVEEILEILACVQSGPHEPFMKLEPEIGEYLPQITTIVCLFLDWNEPRRRFVDRLCLDGAALKVIVVRSEPSTLDPRSDTTWGEISVIGRADFDRDLQEL